MSSGAVLYQAAFAQAALAHAATAQSIETTSTTAQDTSALLLLVIILLPLLGIVFSLTPYLMKKSELFAVTVPESAIHDSFLAGLKRRYMFIVLAATALLTVLSLGFFAFAKQLEALVCVISGSLILVALSYVLMLYYRKKVIQYKREQGWEAKRKESVAVINEQEVPGAVSITWNVLYLPVFIVTALIGYLGYDAMPAQIPMQMGFNGEIGNWMDKSPLVIWVPVFIELFFAACFVIAHWAICRSKRPSDPTSPLASSYAYGMFARSQSLYLVVGGLLMTAAMITMPLTFMGILTLMQAALLIMLAALVLSLGAVIISLVYGQGGSRVFRRMQESEQLLADDDYFWKLGIFYFNPEDPNWFLPARFGIGWTCNFARPFVWVLTAGVILLSVVFIVALLAIV